MTETFTHDTYLSPLTWRYGSEAMRAVWSERHKRLLLRRFWVALAVVQHEAGLVTSEQLADLRAHEEQIDLARAAQIEAEIRHDLMAEIRTYAEQCPVGGGIIHLGATSMDALDNVDALRLREALDLLLDKLAALLRVVAEQIERHARLACMGFTHLQPAEPTTVGYRLAQYGYDLLVDWQELRRVRGGVRAKGLRGAVGTSASYGQLLEETGWTPERLEERVLDRLGIDAHPAGTQVYPRKQDWLVVNALAGLAQSIYRLAFDLRVLQAPTIGEWSEPFGAKQVGSSAMPFKRNPIDAENLDSLARQLAALPRIAWDNAAHSLLERTLDDSANRRMLLPEAFLLADELVGRATRVVEGLVVREEVVARNLATYGVFAATERLLMEAVKAGGDRQALHEVIREHSLVAWDALRRGQPNPLASSLRADPRITRWLLPGEVASLLDAGDYVGDAAERALAVAGMLREEAGAA
ncbi:MAG TPA: adenylosuccinate lyase [Anaerolineae bacterium]|nr:adenylosuccinate lyase [Anaerolineae bacterium]